MKIAVITIFPDLFSDFFRSSLIGKAIERGILSVSLINIRDFAPPPHFSVDDAPYGGGAGMVMKPEPLAAAIEAAKAAHPHAKVVLLSPTGKVFSQTTARAMSTQAEIIFVCGRYEAIDQRVIDEYIDEELSIGDYILMGGEIPAMVVIEATTRLIGNVVGNKDSLSHESFEEGAGGLLEAPHYTRPPVFHGRPVPEVLLSGDHAKIAAWRRDEGLERTRTRRPDLLTRLSKNEQNKE